MKSPVMLMQNRRNADEVTEHEGAVAEDRFSGAMPAPRALYAHGASIERNCGQIE